MNNQEVEWATRQLEIQIEAAGLLADTHPVAPVPTCDPWTMRELAEHFVQLSAVWCVVVRTPAAEAFDPGAAAATAPDLAEPGERAAQFQRQFAPLVQSFRELSPAASSWWFEFADWTVADLLRRTLVETAVHLWDAQNAAGNAQPLATEVAAMSLQDDRRLWIRRKAQGATPPTGCVVLDTGDGPKTGWWHGAMPDTEHATVVAFESASSLCLSRWGRADPDEIKVTGDRDVLNEWIRFLA